MSPILPDRTRAAQSQTLGFDPFVSFVEIIDASEDKPRRIPSAKWRELIKKVWEADPLVCPKCQNEMRIVALIDDRDVIERILRHLGLWQEGVRVAPAQGPRLRLPTGPSSLATMTPSPTTTPSR